MKIKLLALCLIALSACAHSRLGARDPASSGPLKFTENSEAWLAKLRAAWKKKCDDADFYAFCAISECDVAQESCRPGRVLLFRGSRSIRDDLLSSALQRSVRQGMNFASSNGDQAALTQLESDLKLLQAMKEERFHEAVVLERKGGKSVWRRDDETQSVLAETDTEKFHDWTITQMAMAYHLAGVGVAYREGKRSFPLDPLISFSADPGISLQFMEPDDPKAKVPLLVISVPEKEILTNCGNSFPSPGEIINTSSKQCVPENEHALERELDSFYAVNPDHIFLNLAFPYPTDVESTIGD